MHLQNLAVHISERIDRSIRGFAYAPALAVSSCTLAPGPCQWQLVYHPSVAASRAVKLKRSALQGRDANRLLQRVIKAEEKKKKLPKMIARLRQQLAEWQAPPQNNKAFVLGHVAYGAEVLDLIEEELKVMADVKPRKVRYLPYMHYCTGSRLCSMALCARPNDGDQTRSCSVNPQLKRSRMCSRPRRVAPARQAASRRAMRRQPASRLPKPPCG